MFAVTCRHTEGSKPKGQAVPQHKNFPGDAANRIKRSIRLYSQIVFYAIRGNHHICTACPLAFFQSADPFIKVCGFFPDPINSCRHLIQLNGKRFLCECVTHRYHISRLS